jgi:3-phenylpropionate/cinnamic acid dioxygenase small subunit
VCAYAGMRVRSCPTGPTLAYAHIRTPAYAHTRIPAPMDRLHLRLELDELYAAYAACLDDGALEDWPGFFTDTCRYEIIPRDNYERGLPLALMRCESRAMLVDRVAALRRSSVYAPRALRHLVSGLRVVTVDGEAIRAQASYAVLQTLSDEETTVFNTGRYLDRLVREHGTLKFQERLCIFDSVLVPGSLVYPI